MQDTWGNLIAAARLGLWPFPGEAKPLIDVHTTYFHLAAMDLQHWIPELQVNNTTVFPFCATYWDCGKTVVDAQVGQIKRLYTIANSEWCSKVFYDEKPYCEVECWAKNLLNSTMPDGSVLTMGFRLADASSDSTCGRAHVGVWARRRRRLSVAPWIQSNENLVVEWDGVKKVWDPTDVLDTELWDDRVMNAIKMFVKWYHEKFHGCDREAMLSAERNYNNERADLMHYFKEYSQQQESEACCEERLPTSEEITAEAVPE